MRKAAEFNRNEWFLNVSCMIEEGGDDGCHFDTDGHMISARLEREGQTPRDVSVLIAHDITPAQVASVLRKIADWAENGGLMEKDHLEKLERWVGLRPADDYGGEVTGREEAKR